MVIERGSPSARPSTHSPSLPSSLMHPSSPGHKAVLLNTGTWGSYDPWPAMGAAMRGDFAVIWFGSAPG